MIPRLLARPVSLFLMLCFAGALAGPAMATVDLRVQASPVTDPIRAFVTVTNANGSPVGSLNASDFTLTLDGAAVATPTFSLPPNQDATRRVSVIFALDYSVSVQNAAASAMQTAVTNFINAMHDGDFAAIVKFNSTNANKASVVQGFTAIDHASGTSTLLTALAAPYAGNGTNLLDAVNLATNQFVTPPMTLPAGPKAIIVITDGGENASTTTEGTVNDNASSHGISIFTVGVGTVLKPELLTRLANQTGGQYLPSPNDAAIATAYSTVSNLLNNEYLLSFSSSITDCSSHNLKVTVNGQTDTETTAFVRCGAAPVAPAPPATPASSGKSGGGGALGGLDLLAVLMVLIARFALPRLRVARGFSKP